MDEDTEDRKQVNCLLYAGLNHSLFFIAAQLEGENTLVSFFASYHPLTKICASKESSDNGNTMVYIRKHL